MREGSGLIVTGLGLLAVCVLVLATPTSLPCGSPLFSTPADELGQPLVGVCPFERHDRMLWGLLVGAPGLVLVASGLALRAARTDLRLGEVTMLGGLLGLSVAAVLALVPVQLDCGTVIDPTTRAEINATHGPFFSSTCPRAVSERLNTTLVLGAPAAVVAAGGWVLHRSRRLVPPYTARGGGGLVVAGLALLAVAVVLLAAPMAPVCGSVLDPSAADRYPCSPEWRLLEALLVAAPGVVLTVAGLVVCARPTVLEFGGWTVLVGVVGLSIAAVLAAAEISPGCGSVLFPSQRTLYGPEGGCPAVDTTRLWVLLFAAPATAATVAGLVRRTRS